MLSKPQELSSLLLHRIQKVVTRRAAHTATIGAALLTLYVQLCSCAARHDAAPTNCLPPALLSPMPMPVPGQYTTSWSTPLATREHLVRMVHGYDYVWLPDDCAVSVVTYTYLIPIPDTPIGAPAIDENLLLAEFLGNGGAAAHPFQRADEFVVSNLDSIKVSWRQDADDGDGWMATVITDGADRTTISGTQNQDGIHGPFDLDHRHTSMYVAGVQSSRMEVQSIDMVTGSSKWLTKLGFAPQVIRVSESSPELLEAIAVELVPAAPNKWPYRLKRAQLSCATGEVISLSETRVPGVPDSVVGFPFGPPQHELFSSYSESGLLYVSIAPDGVLRVVEIEWAIDQLNPTGETLVERRFGEVFEISRLTAFNMPSYNVYGLYIGAQDEMGRAISWIIVRDGTKTSEYLGPSSLHGPITGVGGDYQRIGLSAEDPLQSLAPWVISHEPAQ